MGAGWGGWRGGGVGGGGDLEVAVADLVSARGTSCSHPHVCILIFFKKYQISNKYLEFRTQNILDIERGRSRWQIVCLREGQGRKYP